MHHQAISSPRSSRSDRRPLRWSRLLLAILILIGALAALEGRLLVWPASDPPGTADAVLVLAGGRGEREATGVHLVQQGVAPVLVFSDGGRPGSASARLCQQRLAGIQVRCLTPAIGSTRGEARAFAALSDREGWHSVVVVTSSYHSYRAGLLIRRCYGGSLQTVAAPPAHTHGLQLLPFLLRENARLLLARTVRRGC